MSDDVRTGAGGAGPLYFLAFDHRGVFARSVLDVAGAPTPEQEALVADCKRVIFDGVAAAAATGRVAPGRLGVLVDELYGADVARAARAAGIVLTMPVEKPDEEVFDFAYGPAFGEHIEAFSPDFAKVLVRYNAEGDAAGNATQLERLARLSSWLRARDRRLLFELLVVPTAAQLAAAGGDRTAFEHARRPELMCRAMAEIQDAGIEVDVWKLEGIDDPEAAAAVVRRARSGTGRDAVTCTVLGAGADAERVEHWLRVAAGTEGFSGFAIGRSIWRDPLRRLLAGSLDRPTAVQRIAEHYLRFVDVYEEGTSARSPLALSA